MCVKSSVLFLMKQTFLLSEVVSKSGVGLQNTSREQEVFYSLVNKLHLTCVSLGVMNTSAYVSGLKTSFW